MLDFDTARALLLEQISPLSQEEVPLNVALGRTLAEDLVSERPIPPFDYSAMDGYAVNSDDLRELPCELPTQGESRAGSAGLSLGRGTTCRIFTGGALPQGANAVVMQEQVTLTGNAVRFELPVEPGQHVRLAGEDLAQGQVALPAGVRLEPFQLGLVAMLDRNRVMVRRKPRVCIVTTGDELRPPGTPGPAHSIPESNSHALSALVERAAGEVLRHEVAPDSEPRLLEVFQRGLEGHDLLITVGGVSVGDHDLVRPMLGSLGVEEIFWKVAMKPGKPLYYGCSRGGCLVLGLPGNPASSQVTFALFGIPLLRALQGVSQPIPPWRLASLAEPLQRRPGRREFYRGKLEGSRVSILKNQASGAPAMAWANALVSVPADCTELGAHADVKVLALNDL